MADRREEWGPWRRVSGRKRGEEDRARPREPVASNDDASGRQQNRRVEVSFGGSER